MTRRQLTIKPSCMREISTFPSDRAALLWDKIDALVSDPRPDGKVKKKLKGADVVYRMRVTDHRVFYRFGEDWISLLGIRRRAEDTYNGVPDETADAPAAELQLRERIANKTLAIDFTLGLEQGTGAEAEWMAEYRYQGISALNAWQGDRAIEQIAGYQQRLRRLMADRGIEAEWLTTWNGWLREAGSRPDDRIIAWANLGRKGGDAKEYTRQLQPRVVGDVPHWLWTAEKPVEWSKNFWLVLDSNTHPAATRKDLGFSEDASRPVAAEDLLFASRRIIDGNIALEELGREVGRPFQQGASAIAAGVFSEEDRRAIQIRGFRILQLRHLDAAPATVRPSEEAC